MDTATTSMRAVSLFSNGFCCSEAVTSSLCDLFEIYGKNSVLQASSGFCGGMGSGESCGAVCGAAASLGVILRQYSTVKRPADSVSDFIDRFKERFSTISCSQLINDKTKGSQEQKSFCSEIIKFCVDNVISIVSDKREYAYNPFRSKFNIRHSNIYYILVDMQVRLAAAMPTEEFQSAVVNTSKLITYFNLSGVKIAEAKQYPEGLGDTVDSLKDVLQERIHVNKVNFSACHDKQLMSDIALSGAKTIIVSGMETHVCVLQTVLDLLELGYNVHVVEDACISRTNFNNKNGIRFMRDAGAVITNTETLLFQLLVSSKNEHFKTVSKLIK